MKKSLVTVLIVAVAIPALLILSNQIAMTSMFASKVKEVIVVNPQGSAFNQSLTFESARSE